MGAVQIVQEKEGINLETMVGKSAQAAVSKPSFSGGNGYHAMRQNLCEYISNSNQQRIELAIFDQMVELKNKQVTDVSAGHAAHLHLKSLDTELEEQDIANCQDIDQLKNYLLKATQCIKQAVEKINPDGYKAPAFIFVLGYDAQKHKRFMHNGNWYENPEPVLQGDYVNEKVREEFRQIAVGDQATVIDKNGMLVAKKVYLKGDPDDVIKYSPMKHESSKEIQQAMGFAEEVNARHKSSIAASYALSGAVVYTLSEETGTIRRFENGVLTHSTNVCESHTPKYAL